MSREFLHENYYRHVRSRIWFIVLTGIFMLLIMVVSLALGPAGIKLRDIAGAIWSGENRLAGQIIFQIRMPRIIAGVLGGTALAVSGAAMQNILRNPLGSPFTLGISHAAAFGAAFAIVVFGAGTTHSSSGNAVVLNNPALVTLSAFCFSMLCTILILAMARFRGATPETMILTGIVLGSLFTAGTAAFQYFADEVELSSIVFWTFGDLGRASWGDIVFLSVVCLPATAFFIGNRWNYDSLNSGDETARSLGVNVERTRVSGMLVASLATSVAVSFFGIIAFVGLVVPHIIRRMIGGDEKFLIPASALFGGGFLLLADTLARTLLSPVVLPVGIITSFIGAPLFIYLLLKGMGRRYW